MKERITILKNRLFAVRFLRFFISGLTAFVVDTTVLILLKALVFHDVDIKILGTISLAKLISGSFGIVVMFTLNRFWVFSEKKGVSLKKQGSKYLGVTIFNLFLASIFYSIYSAILTQLIGPTFLTNISLSVTLTNLLTEGTKMILSFFAYKYLVFR